MARQETLTTPEHGPTTASPSRVRWALGFVAGFIAVLVFHQVALALLTQSGFVQAATYSAKATWPFGVPQVLSTAFWGGVWGVALAWAQRRFPRGAAYGLAAFLFGALLPSLVAWFVVAPLKGLPFAAGGDVHRLVAALVANGVWGLGTVWLYKVGGDWAAPQVREP
jgi:hypothetical protein